MTPRMEKILAIFKEVYPEVKKPEEALYKLITYLKENPDAADYVRHTVEF
jgi:hypothetical protein